MEYFRPGVEGQRAPLVHQLYRDQPHIQYMIWRAIGWGFTGIGTALGFPTRHTSWRDSGRRSILRSSPSTGTSRRSWTAARSSSLTGSKQNYYYSTAYPVSAIITAERIWRLRLSLGQLLFLLRLCTGHQGEHAYDTLHIIKPSAGIYLLDNLMLNFNYERWNIDSTLNGE